MPVEKYSRAPEILAHSRAIGRHFDLYRRACFQTEVTRMRWDEAASRWIVSTNRGDAMRARFVVMANGPLHRPKLPGIPGIESFKGHSFHTSRWDYDYTGGDSDGGLTGLKDKRVGIIGTGATAVQCVPHLAAAAKALYVFQRTPSSIDVRANRPTDPEWAASLAPGWQQRRMDNFNILVSGGFQEEDLVNDGWTDIIRNLLILARRNERAGEAAPGRGRRDAGARRLPEDGADPRPGGRADQGPGHRRGAEALLPPVLQAAVLPRRLSRHLQPPQRHPGRHRRRGRGADHRHAVWANGRDYEVDCLIYATGFEVGTGYTRRSGFELHGRDGRTLTEKWDDGVRTLHGLHARGFPNCFIVSQRPVGLHGQLPAHAERAGQAPRLHRRPLPGAQVRTLEASEAAEEAWVQTISPSP